jgi:hypothetical protein
VHRLGTIATVLGTKAALDITEGTELDGAGVMVGAVYPLGLKQKIRQGLVVNLSNSRHGGLPMGVWYHTT